MQLLLLLPVRCGRAILIGIRLLRRTILLGLLIVALRRLSGLRGRGWARFGTCALQRQVDLLLGEVLGAEEGGALLDRGSCYGRVLQDYGYVLDVDIHKQEKATLFTRDLLNVRCGSRT